MAYRDDLDAALGQIDYLKRELELAKRGSPIQLLNIEDELKRVKEELKKEVERVEKENEKLKVKIDVLQKNWDTLLKAYQKINNNINDTRLQVCVWSQYDECKHYLENKHKYLPKDEEPK